MCGEGVQCVVRVYYLGSVFIPCRAFGVLLWEIMSLGRTPLEGMTPDEIVQLAALKLLKHEM